MAAAFLLVLLLLVAGGATSAGDEEVGLPRLEFRGIDDTAGRGHGSFEPEEPVLMARDDDGAGDALRHEFRGINGSDDVHASEEQAFTDVISTGGVCGRFARLVAETGNAGQLFWERAAGAGGLTVFCRVRAQVPWPRLRRPARRPAVPRRGVMLRQEAAEFEWVSVNSLATDAATNKSHAITVRDDGDTVWLWPSCVSGAGVRVTKTVSEEAPLAVYVVDAVLLPSHLQQKLDGGDERAAACKPSGGDLGWLYTCIPAWAAISMVVAGIADFHTGYHLQDALNKKN